MDRFSRRHFLRLGLVGSAVGFAGCSQVASWNPDPSDNSISGAPTDTETRTVTEQSGSDGVSPVRISLETVASGFETPLDVAFAPETDRRYVVEQSGLIHSHDPDGVREEPFLDLSGSIESGGEMGVLGLALHPEFGTNRRCFVRYSAPPRAGTPEGYSHTFVLSEFQATADGTRILPDSEQLLLELPEPQGNHNAGTLAFGPDGYLYVGVGDGGGGGDQGAGHVTDWYGRTKGGNGQDVTENLLGSILRIDIDTQGENKPYGIPEDNPLVGQKGLDEHYAWGFRNPWRFSFDEGRLFVGDVGQRRSEEVNLVEKGGNYGWNVREGTSCFQADSCPDATPNGQPLLDPMVEYPHASHSNAPISGVSVIGGYVYRGSALPSLAGTYVFGDLQANGRLFVATPPDDESSWSTQVLPITGSDLGRLFAFGRDTDGEVYVLGDGQLARVIPDG